MSKDKIDSTGHLGDTFRSVAPLLLTVFQAACSGGFSEEETTSSPYRGMEVSPPPPGVTQTSSANSTVTTTPPMTSTTTYTPPRPPPAPVTREFYVGPEQLYAAAAQLQANVALKLDNFTPNAYQYCAPGAPAGCPEPNADPETYQFFAKDSSVFVVNGRAYPFSLIPARGEPFTFYIDDMSTTLIQLFVDADELGLAISFEGDGTEVRANCIRNAGCAFAGSQDRDFPQPLLHLRFRLTAGNGQLQVASARAQFFTGAANEDPQLLSYVTQAIESALLEEQGFRAFINAVLNGVLLRFADPQHCKPTGVAIGSGQVHVSSVCQSN